MKDLNFIPECYVDTNLIETLMNVGVNHQHCCSKVTNVMECTMAGSFAVGIIDDDKKKTTYVQSFILIAQTNHFKVMKHHDRPHYLIVISPAVDKFILDCAKESNIDVKKYDLPGTLTHFKEQAKKITSNRDPRFKLLFKAMKDNKEFSSLSKVLSYLREKRYDSLTEDIVRLID